MFIRYQSVRNAVLTLTAGTVVGGLYFWGSAKPATMPQGLVDHAPVVAKVTPTPKPIEVPAKEIPTQSMPIAKVAELPISQDPVVLLHQAMKVANDSSVNKKGTDILGTKSPWKLNLYDDDSDGNGIAVSST